ncbi:MAG: DsbC family protein [Burkholderiaceae bacterium]
MKLSRIVAVALLAALSLAGGPAAIAQTKVLEAVDPVIEPVSAEAVKAIQDKVRQWTGGRFEATEVRGTPMASLLEIRIQNDLYYIDRNGRYIIIDGEFVDMQTNRNFTRERMEQVLAIDFDTLPVDKAVKWVAGKGERKVVVFEDPNCTYCRRLRADLMRIDNITVYTFAFPILAADSDTKSRQALCDADPVKAWNDLMLTGRPPDNDGKCDTPIAQFKALGEKLGIQATPTMFFPSGKRLQGYAPPTRFVDMLDQNQKPQGS